MAYHFIDNVHSKSLTPREPNVELLDASCEKNIIVCLCNSSGKTFIASKLTQNIINKASKNKGTISVFVADSPVIVSRQASCFKRLTNMMVGEYHNANEFKMGQHWKQALEDWVLVMETHVAVELFKKNFLCMSDINLLILHGCQCVLKCDLVPMNELMKFYFESEKKPHVLGLASSLFSSGLDLSQMESSLTQMEDLLNCKVETASNITSTLRYGTHPQEFVIEYEPHIPSSIDTLIEEEILNAITFIRDHRYDPMEMYEGFTEELQNIPDPKFEPEEILLDFLDILHTLGSWSADRAALVLLIKVEKLKVTTPYERHFLLLCMVSSVLVKIRAIFDHFFENMNEKERILKHSSLKMLRVIEILRKFQPEKCVSDFDEFSEDGENKENPSGLISDSHENLKSKENNKNLCSLLSELVDLPCLNCDCELITEFLLMRSKYSELCNISFEEYKNRKSGITDQSKAVLLSSKNSSAIVNDTNRVTKLKQNYSHKNHKDSNKINDNYIDNQCMTVALVGEKSNVKVDDKKSLNDILQKKNGYLSDSSFFNMTMSESQNIEKKINEISTIENYLQYHEYLLLPKFKVDRHARYDRFNMSNQLKRLGQDEYTFRQIKSFGDVDVQLCGLIFVEKKFTATVLFHVLNDLKQADEDFSFLNVQFTVGKVVDGTKDPKGAENEHRKQELVLKKFRMRACNLLIGTSFLEEGIDLPKCNLVIRFDLPKDYRSYINTKERARATDALHCFLVDTKLRDIFVEKLGEYYEIEAMLLKKCSNLEPEDEEEKEADIYSQLIQPFCPLLKENCPHVDLSTAIALVNRYCAKLPSDTFTRLTPIWNIKTVKKFGREMFICSIRLPINSPVKREIEGCPMPTKVLARRFTAFQCCQLLHFSRELDDTLQPISKESFWMREEEQLTATSEELEEMIPKDSMEPRPGTTKRRQYYYKRIADSLTDCLPVAGKPSFLYDISMALTCPLPEEQNTRGRKIHPPEDSSQGFGILTSKIIPKIGPFPIFTRSGEVQVKLHLSQATVYLSEFQIEKIVGFIHYTFTSVLRLQKYLMMFDPNASENAYFIVPTKRGKDPQNVEVDWDFLELIYQKRNQVPVFIPEEERRNFFFDSAKFEDAVVSPWYRNQDQPQYFYVAEICTNLSPKSSFPGTEYETFEEYYLKKYNIQIQNCSQALLDVDHTSARLNFLTPRYVNRKGVALPTTSEEKKRAKRENLKQKQILVPELCNIHPFPATLWRKAVCLPCILHRINALLLADQVRRVVAKEIGVGSTDLDKDFNWKPLDFGWSLADVLKQTKLFQKQQEETIEREDEQKVKGEKTNFCTRKLNNNIEKNDEEVMSQEENDNEKTGPWLEIGTWSNDMLNTKLEDREIYDFGNIDENFTLPRNLTMIEKSDICAINGWDSEISTELDGPIRYGSPTNWFGETKIEVEDFSDYTSDDSYSDVYFEESSSTDSNSECGGIKIEFTEDNVAEAVEDNQRITTNLRDIGELEEYEPWHFKESEKYSKYAENFKENVKKQSNRILKSKKYFTKDEPFDFHRSTKSSKCQTNNVLIKSAKDPSTTEVSAFGNSNNIFPQLINPIPEKLKSLPLTSLILKLLKEEEGKVHSVKKKEDKETSYSYMDFQQTDDVCLNFSFDEQPDLNGHPGPSPSLILQALTMSNANDGINLERLETIGDSFLKYAITTYLYCVYDNVHEGKLSHLRSKQVSNFNLYRLGRRKVLGESMIATKFEPHDNWLPPCYYVPRELERALIEAGVPASHWNRADLPSLRNLSKEEICQLVKEKGEKLGIVNSDKGTTNITIPCLNLENMPCFIPYNLMTQHSIPDKSIADCVEALIGAYLVACGPRGALLFMSWLGIKVLPKEEKYFYSEDDINIKRGVGCSIPVKVNTENGQMWSQICFGELNPPKAPLLRHLADPEGELERLLRGFEVFEDSIKYRFRDRSYLLQALTHASYSPNRLTDCYQRLEFLGDAVLDYLITRHLYEDSRHHSPGALTDLRSALVNNTIFASLAVRHNFHKYFRHLCPSLNDVVDRFVRIQQENGHSINEEFYLIEEEECEDTEDVEVPKALGDIFESVAGAIFLDSGMSLDAVWRVYYRIMRKEIELFSTNVPKSPIRELFELEPETAQFGKPEKLADGRRVRVTVEVFGKGVFNGIGRNYRIAKCTAAKCALKYLKRKGLLERRK